MSQEVRRSTEGVGIVQELARVLEVEELSPVLSTEYSTTFCLCLKSIVDNLICKQELIK